MKLYQYNKEDYGTLLASNVLDASKGALFQDIGLEPDTTNRTLLIGLGGTGVRTIDYVKGAIQKRLNPTWNRYVAFLALDTSWTELDGAVYLDDSEKFMYTEPGVARRMSNPNNYPSAVRPFMLEGEQLGALDGDGAGRTRLVGKVKIHDQNTGDRGVDQKIVDKIGRIVQSTFVPMSNNTPGKYTVYVIGSTCGGTCSGAFTELPSLIRLAIPDGDRLAVNGILYLPDTLTSLDPDHVSELKANGYATLKELNYYMGMYMRPNNPERWTFNSPANPWLEHRSNMNTEGFYDLPYLVGSNNGGSADAFDVARETIAEFLISILGRITSVDGNMFLTSAFLINARRRISARDYLGDISLDLEANGASHEFPRRFASIGFAKAAVPQKIVRAYEVGELCRISGVQTVDADRRAELRANGTQLLPFRHEDDLLNAQDGTAKAWELILPIRDILKKLNTVDFDFVKEVSKTPVTWENIRGGHYNTALINTQTENCIQQLTNTTAMNTLSEDIRKAFREFRSNIRQYVKEEGPSAFYNIYTGRFQAVGDNHGVGIKDMLSNLVEGAEFSPKNNSFQPYSFLNPVATAQALENIRNQINNTPNHLLLNANIRRSQSANWTTAFQNKVKARVVDLRRGSVLNQAGSLKREFVNPAAVLADEMKSFGILLERLCGIYTNLGGKMDSFNAFMDASDGRSDVNIAGVDQSAYRWIKAQADAAVAEANAKKFRDELVDAFFENSGAWLEVPDSRVQTGADGKVSLRTADLAVPARECFDRYVNAAHPDHVSTRVAIDSVFEQMNRNGTDYSAAAVRVMDKLAAYSQPQFNGDIAQDTIYGFIVYPNSLRLAGGDGQAIATAIENAAKDRFPGIQVYASNDADSIMFYQLAAPLEVYRLRELPDWEREYETGNKGIRFPRTYLHGMSPDIQETIEAGKPPKYTNTIPWEDYPSITRQEGDPRQPDPRTGVISREGRIRIALDATIKRAREFGVLYSEQDGNGLWYVKRVFCDRTTEWHFSITGYAPDENGLLPAGKAFMEEVARQNGRLLSDISRIVMLESSGGVLDGHGHPTEELAWKYAARTLRAHVPMYIEVRHTVALLEPWMAEIGAFNALLEERFRPAKMIHMIQGGLLQRMEGNAWVLLPEDGGRPMPIANFSDDMLRFSLQDAQYVKNGLLAYHLFSKLSAQLNAEAFKSAFERSVQMHKQLMLTNDREALEHNHTLADELLNEIDGLRAKGAVIDGDRDIPMPSRKLQESFPWLNTEELKQILAFYYRLGLWDRLRV